MAARVLVVDDAVIFRKIITEALNGIPGVEVAGLASNGKLALSRIAELKPDLLTLDIEMPEMGGIELLERLSSEPSKPDVIVLSAHTRRGGELTVRALELGAFDFITKPEGGAPQENIEKLREALLPVIRAHERRMEIRSILGSGRRVAPAPAAPPVPTLDAPPQRRAQLTGAPIVLIGVSTGGPNALAQLLPALPANLGAPVFIVQHMPAFFTRPLADRLAARCAIKVKEAKDGELAAPNCAYIAPGGKHMKISPGKRGEIVVRTSDDPPENNCRPAVDVLFRSAALNFPGCAVAAVLTGMGSDGAAGLRLLKRGGCYSIAQDEATCVVFGMPKAAIATGAVDMVAPLDDIAGAIVRRIRETAA
jgi:two-component system, chemotaxis family, protein-glutamate methylesterase/glutaminase